MNEESRLMDMLVGYASAHRHPVNIAVHMIGIPTIMLGAFIPLTWITLQVEGITINLAELGLVVMFIFYLTLDWRFAIVFLVLGMIIAQLAAVLGTLPRPAAAIIATAGFLGGFIAQFIGHAVERSMPVLVRHPLQAGLSAPFFAVVELFKLLGLRRTLFDDVQRRIAELRERRAGST